MLIDFKKYDINLARQMAREEGKSALAMMQENIHRLNLIDSGRLLNSLRVAVLSKKGEVDRVQFTYEWYGKFHEMGAKNVFGKGFQINGKHWRNTAIEAVKPRILEKFANYYAELIIEEIKIDSVKMNM